MRHWDFQIADRFTKANIISAGGACQVNAAGSTDKVALTDKNGAALANPVTPIRGFIDFYTADSVLALDLYIQAPGGQFAVLPTVTPASGPNEVWVDADRKLHHYKIPFSIADSVAATEKDTGFDLPATAMVLPRLAGAGIFVTALDTGITIDVGTLTGETGADPNGLNAAAVLTSLGALVGTNGALYASDAPYYTAAFASKSISYTLSSGADTGKGYIILPVLLI